MIGHNNEHDLRRTTTGFQRHFDDRYAVQGRVLWLPAKEDLPKRAVRRAHGKGAIDEGIYNHPIVVISRPDEESNVIHFHLVSGIVVENFMDPANRFQITSHGGKRLDELYDNKESEFHISRRSWYLPISPTPEHPDAISKKTKKRFPTLALANGETLRWDSYVNIRHVYKIDWSLVRPYTNPRIPDAERFRFERESTIRMLAKGRSLTLYEPGPQYVSASLKRSASDPTPDLTAAISRTHEDEHKGKPTRPIPEMMVTMGAVAISVPAQLDFRLELQGIDRIAGPLPKVPPDGDEVPALTSVDQFVEPLERLCGDVQSVALIAGQRLVSLSRDTFTLNCPPTRLWRDMKGVTAVLIASI